MIVGLMARVSTQEQAVNGHSIPEQIERMEKYCEAMGWTVYKVYTDAGFSGGNMERPALQRLIKDVKQGRMDKVLVYKLDRLSRSQKDTLYLIEDVFLANNTDFVSMSENFDTSTPFGRAMIGILAVFAQLEREQIKERMAMGKEARAKQGKFNGTHKAPIGYDLIDGDLVINDFERIQIEQIFEMYAAGIAPYTIERELSNSGYKHKYGEWKHDTIREILFNRTYCGYTRFRKDQWFEGIHEPIISEELFDKCQDILKRRSEEHAKYNRRAGKANSYLGGYMECAHCHAKYSKNTQKYRSKNGLTKYVYYQCNSKTKKVPYLIKDPNCKNKTWKMEELDELVFNEIKQFSIDPDYIAKIRAEAEEDERPKLIDAELSKLDNQLSKLMDLYSVGDMPVDIIQEKIHALNAQKLKLESELEAIKKENEEKLTQAEAEVVVQNFSEILDTGDFEAIRETIGTLIEKIVIDGDDITIHWNIA